MNNLYKLKNFTSYKTIQKFLLFSFILSLCSCNFGEWHWVSSEKPITALKKDILNCQYIVNLQFPPLIYHENAINYGAVIHNSFEQSKSNSYYNYNPYYFPENMVVTYDANKEMREQAFRKCMLDSTWNLEYRNAF